MDAGDDESVALPDVLRLVASATDAETPSGLTLAWSKVSGPGTVQFLDPSAATTFVTFSEGGSYVLRLTADDGELTGQDELAVTVASLVGEVVDIDRATTYQTMTGWEFTDGVASANPSFDLFKDELFDLAADDLGLTRVRLEVRAGAENSVDYWTLYDTGAIDDTQWREVRYSTVNDDGDPDNINGSGFFFSELDDHVERAVLPMQTRLAAKGEHLYVNLCYVAFTDQIGAGLSYDHDDPDEYAEFVLAATIHLETQYGFVPDSWEICLEPDNVAEWDGTLIGQAIVATGDKLALAGYSPTFVAPSVTNMNNFASYFDAMIAVPGVENYLTEASYHRYVGATDANLNLIHGRAAANGLDTSHLELIGATHHDLHKDLELAWCSAWAQFTLAAKHTLGDNGGHYYLIDDTDPGNPVIVPGWRTKYLRQYFKFIRPEAVRVGATSTHVGVEPLMFASGTVGDVLVVKTNAGRTFHVVGLEAGTYGIKYTTSVEYDVDLADVELIPGEILTTTIPSFGVITVYRK